MTSAPAQPRTSGTGPQRILVFHIGSLGDTLVALPALWAIRDAFPDARLTMLTKSGARDAIPVGADILHGTGLFEDFLVFDGDHHAYGSNLPMWRKLWHALRLQWRLRTRRFDLAIYLAPSVRSAAQVRRDLLFFRLAGVRDIIGGEELTAAKGPVPVHEAELLLSRMADPRLGSPAIAHARRDLALGDADREAARAWIARQPGASQGRSFVAFGPGANIQAKLWPVERFAAVGKRLIERFDIWPVVLGGVEDVELGAQLVRAWGRGYNASGALTVRQSAALLESCRVFVGNDTGTMHLAASVGVPCVALFSARDIPGKWDPLGERHQVLRKTVPCAGCMLVRCDLQNRLCMRLIEVEEVVEAAAGLLASSACVAAQPQDGGDLMRLQ